MTQQLPQEVLQELEDQFLNKRISVDIENDKSIIGVCEFIGHNPFFPHWGLQVVVNRYPITNVSIKSIHLAE